MAWMKTLRQKAWEATTKNRPNASAAKKFDFYFAYQAGYLAAKRDAKKGKKFLNALDKS